MSELLQGLDQRLEELRGEAERRQAYRKLFPEFKLPLWAYFSMAGAAVIKPALESSVIEPFCAKTRTLSFRIVESAVRTSDSELPLRGLVLEDRRQEFRRSR